MNCSKEIRVMLALLAFTSTMQVCTAWRTETLINEFREFEPAIIEERVVEPATVSQLGVGRVIKEIKPRIDCPLDDATQQMILDKCEEYEIDFALVMALIFTESSFNPDVISGSNDYGLMQINKINHEWLSEELGITDFLDPEQNVTAGMYMLHDLFEKYTHPGLVLMAYNMGEPGAKRLWNQGIYSTKYAETILQLSGTYSAEIAERMGEND